MILKPSHLGELSGQLAAVNANEHKVESFNLAALNRILEHTPEDMTVTVEAGLTLEAMQAALSKRGQWLPVDPPKCSSSIGAILAENENGPRRFGYGTIRDYLIGLKVIMADGRTVKAGGKVVKNVAGYDLQKLFVGSRGTLGIMVEATFKLRPLPETEQFIQARFDSLQSANAAIEAVLESPLTPTVLDLHNLPANEKVASQKCEVTLVLGFDGTKEDVEWQLAKAKELGFQEKSSVSYDAKLRAETSDLRKLSVLPSKLVETIQSLGGVSFVARAGNGIIYYRGGPEAPKANGPSHLIKRVKDAFDPKHTFPELKA